jgi:PAS domain S-box-containing protein
MTGRSADQLIGRSIADITHPADWAEQQALVREVKDGRRDRYQIRKRYLRPDGAEVWTELSFAAIRGPGGELQYGLGVSVDVTQRQQLEDQLRQAQKMEALGQMAGGIAHDFNNILTAVLGNLSLARFADADPNRELIRAAEQAAARAADLTRKLLGYARKNQLLTAPVKVSNLVDEAVGILRRTFDPRIEVAVHHDPECGPVQVDPSLLNQVLFNLCLNARDAMADGGRLTLTTGAVVIPDGEAGRHPDARPGAFVRVAVRDTGCGMTDDVKARIFEPFFTTKEVGRGTGLGLAMVHGILKQHQGWVECTSHPGRGSCFELFLPPAAVGAANAAPRTVHQNPSPPPPDTGPHANGCAARHAAPHPPRVRLDGPLGGAVLLDELLRAPRERGLPVAARGGRARAHRRAHRRPRGHGARRAAAPAPATTDVGAQRARHRRDGVHVLRPLPRRAAARRHHDAPEPHPRDPRAAHARVPR